jgi:hypothetical protein
MFECCCIVQTCFCLSKPLLKSAFASRFAFVQINMTYVSLSINKVFTRYSVLWQV